jgi:hypothetical protein
MLEPHFLKNLLNPALTKGKTNFNNNKKTLPHHIEKARLSY